MRRLLAFARDWVTTVPTVLAFGAVLVLGDVALRVGRLFGDHPMEVVAGAVQRALIWSFAPSGTRIVVERSPNLADGKGYLFVANHQSIFDIPLFGGVLFSNFPKYVAKEELSRWIPTVSFNLRRGGNALIDRRDRTGSLRTIRDFGRTVQERGVSAVIFPEGSRSRDGRLKTFKPAGAVTLMKAADRLPVVPAVIDGSHRLLGKGMFPVPFGTTVRIRFGEPIEREPGDDPVELLERCRAEIAATLDAWQSSPVSSPA